MIPFKKNKFALFQAGAKQPFRSALRRVYGYSFDVNEKMKILLVLNGELTVRTPRGERVYQRGDFVIINPYEGHACFAADPANLHVELAFDVKEFQEKGRRHMAVRFDEMAGMDMPRQILGDALRAVVFLAWQNYRNEEPMTDLAAVRRVFSVLNSHFMVEQARERIPTGDVYRQILQIVKEINEDVFSDVTLQSMADAHKISLSYLSRTFTLVMGVGLPEYVRNLRVLYAMELLAESTYSVAEITGKAGFSSVKVMGQAFQSALGEAPSKVRRWILTMRKESKGRLEIDDILDLPEVTALLQRGREAHEMLSGREKDRIAVSSYCVDVYGGAKTLFPFWSQILNFEMIGADWRDAYYNNLITVGFRYVRFNLSYHEGMYYIKHQVGSYRQIDLQELGQIIHSVIRNGMMPMIAFDIMEVNVPLILSMSINEMITMVREGVTQLMDYLLLTVQLTMVRRWHFEIGVKLFTSETPGEYYRSLAFYQEVYRTLRDKMGSQFRWGAHLGVMNMAQIEMIFEKGNELLGDGEMPQTYGLDFVMNIDAKHDQRSSDINRWVDRFNQNEILKSLFLKRNPGELGEGDLPPIYCTGLYLFLARPVPGEHILDLMMPQLLLNGGNTLYTNTLAATHMVAYAAERRLEKVSEWVQTKPLWTSQLTDINSIPTPSYFLLSFLNRMGDRLLLSAKDCLVTETETGMQILLYYDGKYGEELTEHKQIKVQISGILGRYVITSEKVSMDYGNARTARNEIGAVNFLSAYEVEYLRGVVRPKLFTKVVELEGVYECEVDLSPHSFAFVELRRY